MKFLNTLLESEYEKLAQDGLNFEFRKKLE